MMARLTKSSDLLGLLEKVTEKQLADVRAKVAEAMKALKSLQALERLMDVKLHGKPERKKRRAGKDAEHPAMKGHRVKAAEYLAHAGTPVRQSVLADAVGCPAGSAAACFSHPWFTKGFDGIELTPEGRKMTG